MNAAPQLTSAALSGGGDVATEAELARPDLGALKVQFGTIPAPQVAKSKSDNLHLLPVPMRK